MQQRTPASCCTAHRNSKNPIYRELFLSAVAAAKSAGAAGGGGEEEAAGASVCRFCFSSEGDLIAPCMCRGSNEWVHLECLRAWQRAVVLAQPTHTGYQTNIDTVCNVCLEPFSGAGAPRSRHEQILEFMGGR